MSEPDDKLAHVEPVLSPADDPTPPIRRGPRLHREVPRDEDHTPVGFAPVPYQGECTDRSGFVRRIHEWDRDGRCYFCSARRREP